MRKRDRYWTGTTKQLIGQNLSKNQACGDTKSFHVCGYQNGQKGKNQIKNKKNIHVSGATCHMSCIPCQVSCITGHMFCVACNLSPVTKTNSHSHSHRPSPCYLPNYAQLAGSQKKNLQMQKIIETVKSENH